METHQNAWAHTYTHKHTQPSCVHYWEWLAYCTSRVILSSHINYRNHISLTLEVFSCFILANLTVKALQLWALCAIHPWEESEISLTHMPIKHYITPVTFSNYAFCCFVHLFHLDIFACYPVKRMAVIVMVILLLKGFYMSIQINSALMHICNYLYSVVELCKYANT